MNIEYIDSNHKLFPNVMQLGKKHSATLGFMPEGGFIEHANKKCIIIAYDNDELCGYLMFRVVKRDSRVSIAHLCVDPKYRGKRITTLLLNDLMKKYRDTYNGISLSCRDDYKDASKVWQKYGFVYKDKIRSRSIDEHYLNRWWYDFNKPDLFSCAHQSSLKIKALFDANIILKLRDCDFEHSASEDPRVLMSDWLVDETLYYYAPEMYNEIDRDNNKERATKTRKYLDNFAIARYDIEEMKKIEKSLRNIIKGTSDNDISDRKQLAACILSDINYFITLDGGILSHREKVEDSYGIQIFNPHEFVLNVDELLHKEDYLPSLLKGVTSYENSKITSRDIGKCIIVFSYSDKNRKVLKDIISNAITFKYHTKLTKDKKGEVTALYAHSIEGSIMLVHLLRVANIVAKSTLHMHLVSDLVQNGIDNDIKTIEITDPCIETELEFVLSKLGFIKDGPKWIKQICNQIISMSSVGDFIQNQNINFSYTPINIDDFLRIEHLFYPLKIWDVNIPCYIIPIQSYWASQLFDYKIAANSLFGAEEEKLWNVENVYYRSTRPITEIAPARILWYASKDKDVDRSKSIVATSYLDEVISDKPQKLFRDNKHYGIFEWHNIYKLSKNDINRNIRLLRFSKTEVFEYPIPLTTVQNILENKNTFPSPVIVGVDVFEKIYKLGKWKK